MLSESEIWSVFFKKKQGPKFIFIYVNHTEKGWSFPFILPISIAPTGFIFRGCHFYAVNIMKHNSSYRVGKLFMNDNTPIKEIM